MLRLVKQEERWLEPLPGVRIRVAPITRATWREARRAAAAALRASGETGEAAISGENAEAAGDEMSRVLIERGIIEWEGVADQDGAPLPVTPEAIALLLDDPARFDAIDQAYILPWLLRDAEGNGSAGSPNGISTKATPARITASRRAKRGGRAKGAANARTASTSSKARTPPTSGK